MEDWNENEMDFQTSAEEIQPVKESADTGKQSAGHVLKTTFHWVYKLRSLLLAIPVVIASVVLAVQNMARLPESVGINLLATGEYQFMVSRNVAVMGPLAVTALCLLMMFCSRKVLYPWLISVFSLALPWLIWITNVFPS